MRNCWEVIVDFWKERNVLVKWYLFGSLCLVVVKVWCNVISFSVVGLCIIVWLKLCFIFFWCMLWVYWISEFEIVVVELIYGFCYVVCIVYVKVDNVFLKWSMLSFYLILWVLWLCVIYCYLIIWIVLDVRNNDVIIFC